MERCILLGVDPELSLQTQQALHATRDLFARTTTGLHIILVTVIPLPYDPSPALAKSLGRGQIRQPAPTSAQRAHAREALARAGALLQQSTSALAAARLELILRCGDPAEEVVRLARERWADCVVLGSRGNSTGHTLRRLFGASISGDIARLVPCPVLLVTAPRRARPPNLLPWRSRDQLRHVKG